MIFKAKAYFFQINVHFPFGVLRFEETILAQEPSQYSENQALYFICSKVES